MNVNPYNRTSINIPSVLTYDPIQISNVFSDLIVEPEASTGTITKFNPVTGTESTLKNGILQNIITKHQCISCMKVYQNKSFEELQWEDYQANRKGPQFVNTNANPIDRLVINDEKLLATLHQMQQSINNLTNEVASLKAANLELLKLISGQNNNQIVTKEFNSKAIPSSRVSKLSSRLIRKRFIREDEVVGDGANKKRLWLYVSRVNRNINVETIRQYLRNKPNCHDKEFVIKELTTSERQHKCFLIGADCSLRQQIYEPSFWPRDVAFRTFYFSKYKKTK